jgi:hypothetical protein
VDCDSFNISYKVTQEDGGSKLSIETSGGQAPFKYIVSKISGALLSEDFDNNTIKSIAPGKYSCTVIDRSNCKKTIEIEVK